MRTSYNLPYCGVMMHQHITTFLYGAMIYEHITTITPLQRMLLDVRAS
jgi:hypothetical protein